MTQTQTVRICNCFVIRSSEKHKVLKFRFGFQDQDRRKCSNQSLWLWPSVTVTCILFIPFFHSVKCTVAFTIHDLTSGQLCFWSLLPISFLLTQFEFRFDWGLDLMPNHVNLSLSESGSWAWVWAAEQPEPLEIGTLRNSHAQQKGNNDSRTK